MNLPSEDEITRTVETYSGNVLRLSYAFLKNQSDAEDISQEVFITYMKKSPEFMEESSKKAWLLRVTSNKCKDFLRFRKRRPTVELADNFGYMPEESGFLLSVVMRMDEKYRIPIHLYYYEDYSIKEIAKILHTNPATIGTRLARGRKHLKEMIETDDSLL